MTQLSSAIDTNLQRTPRPEADARTYWGILALFCLGFAMIAIDMPIVRWIGGQKFPGDIAKVLNLAEVFAHGVGIAGILICVAVMCPDKRWALTRVICMLATVGLAANFLKLFVERTRPRAFDLSQSALDSFIGFLPLTSAGSKGQSIPSAHTASAVVLAIAMIWMLPRGRYLWVSLAVLASTQRITASAHYPSDVIWGLALGLLIGYGILHGWLSNPWLDRWERYCYARRPGQESPAQNFAQSPQTPAINPSFQEPKRESRRRYQTTRTQRPQGVA